MAHPVVLNNHYSDASSRTPSLGASYPQRLQVPPDKNPGFKASKQIKHKCNLALKMTQISIGGFKAVSRTTPTVSVSPGVR